MTCTCKQEIASILRKQAGINDALGTLDTDLSPVRQVLAKTLSDIADRLSPAPAEPAPEAELAGWRAKCFIPKATFKDFYIAWSESDANTNPPTHWLCEDGQWHRLPHARDHYKRFDNESAAVAALLAASEPGKPAPASTPAFDAEKWAEKMVDCYPTTPSTISIGSLDRTVGASLFLPDFKKEVLFATVKDWRNYIAAALRAAHAEGDTAGYARGKAEQRLRYEVRSHNRTILIAAFPDMGAAVLYSDKSQLWSVVDTQPAAPDAKEAP